MREIHTHFLPTLFDPAELRGGTAVVIDVLRASTTICHALAAGATAVVPCAEVEDALRLKQELTAEDPVLGGERDGKLIGGFDLDNSPFRYTPETVAGRTVVFTTTNGTRALLRCEQAERILIGAFTNLRAVVQALRASDGPMHLVCAGTNGRITEEDVLCAGAMACGVWQLDHDDGFLPTWLADLDEPFQSIPPPITKYVDDETQIAATLFRASWNRLPDALRSSRGGRNCLALGFDADVARAAEMNRFDVVPWYSTSERRITCADHIPGISENPWDVRV